MQNSVPEYQVAWLWVSNLLDVSGIYLKEDVFDMEMFAKYNPWWFIEFWERYKSIVYEWRKIHRPSYIVYMECLVNTLRKYKEEHPELLTP